MTGFTQHPNDLGGLTGIAFVPALMIATQPLLRTWLRPLCVLPLGLITAGLLLSGSVGGLAAASIAGVVWLLLDRTASKATAAVSLAVILSICVFVGQSRSDVQTQFARFGRVTAMNGGQEATLQSRLVTNRDALAIIDRDPFVGVGLEQASSYTTNGMDVHNLLLGSWFQSGLLGLIGMLLMLITSAWYAWHNLAAAADRAQYSSAVALAGSLVAFLVVSMSHPGLYQRHGWVAVALCIASATQQVAHDSEEPA